MTTLKEEYAQYKKHKENIIDGASNDWVQKNIILVNERIDRKTVNRLTNSIVKFDSEFGQFKQQLPGHFSVTNYVNKPKCQLHHPNKRLSSYAVEPIRLYLTRVSKLQSLNCSLETTKSKLVAQKVISSHSRLKTTKLSSDSQNN